MLLLALGIAGCGSDEGADATPVRERPTTIPTTPTPRSTPLPTVHPAPELGESERPIVIQFALPGDNAGDDTGQARDELERRLGNKLALSIEVQFVNDSEALKAICSGAPTIAWVNPFTFVTAQKQCQAEPILALKRGIGRNLSVGQTTEIVARAEIGSMRRLSDKAFCRIDGQDFISWILPSLIMASQGVNPLIDLSGVRDYPDNTEMVRAVYEGKCAAAALPPDELDDILDDLAELLSTDEEPVSERSLANQIEVLSPAGDTSFPPIPEDWPGYDTNVIPYQVLVFPPESAIPEPTREDLIEAITDFFDDSDGATCLGDLFNTDDLPDVSGVIQLDMDDTDYLAAFSNLVTQARWDMTLAE